MCDSKLAVGECEWMGVQGVSCLLPYDSWDTLQHVLFIHGWMESYYCL